LVELGTPRPAAVLRAISACGPRGGRRDRRVTTIAHHSTDRVVVAVVVAAIVIGGVLTRITVLLILRLRVALGATSVLRLNLPCHLAIPVGPGRRADRSRRRRNRRGTAPATSLHEAASQKKKHPGKTLNFVHIHNFTPQSFFDRGLNRLRHLGHALCNAYAQAR
jgi:hypothetical protein